MNSYAVIILTTIVVEYLLSVVANLLNVRSLQPTPPADLAGLYDSEKYRRSQEYTRVRTRFRLLSDTSDLLLAIAFWFAGGFNALDLLVRGWELGPIWTGLVYIGILVGARGMISLPFALYSTFGIEERFGFNKTTPATFFVDRIKGIVLGILIGGPLLAGILAFFEYAGPFAWLYGWIAASAFILLVQFVAPAWIMPLFNKYKPLDGGDLRESILAYASSVNFGLADIFIMDGSRRSTRSNAFFTGFGSAKRIALFDTLVERHTVPELVAVVAHEVGHYKRRHIVQGLMISILHIGLLLFLLSIFVTEPGLFQAFFMERQSVYAGLIFFGMLLAPIEMIVSILQQLWSRRNEFEADNYAVTTTGTPEALVDALKNLSVDNLANLTPHPFYVFLYYSHPPLTERIRAIRAIGV